MSIHLAMRPVRRMVQCEGIVSLAMPCYYVTRLNRGLLLNKRICSHRDQIISFKSRPSFGQVSSSREANRMSQKLSLFEKYHKKTTFHIIFQITVGNRYVFCDLSLSVCFHGTVSSVFTIFALYKYLVIR